MGPRRRGRTPTEPDLDRLRVERLVRDGVTGLPLLPLGFGGVERVPHLGVVYVQVGRFAGLESMYGWQLYDQVLRLVTESLQADLGSSALAPYLMSLQFNGSDGFYLLFNLPVARNGGVAARLDAEASRFREGVVRRLRQKMDRSMVDLMSVHAAALAARDDPRARPSRNLVRALRDAARMVESQEKTERQEIVADCREILAGRKLRAVYQPVFDIQARSVVGYEALIRGPAGGDLESPDLLFAAARESDLGLELESLCLETIFSGLPRATQRRKLFVNASPRLLTHAVFLDDRNLAEIKRAHPEVVIEVSEKEVVGDYPAFRGVLDRLRGHGLEIAIDDAGSGYSGLESILQLRPQYIKVANTLVQNLHAEGIKRGVIAALATVGRDIQASLIAEGIEQPEELDALVDLGVAYGQGFLLGRPTRRIYRRAH